MPYALITLDGALSTLPDTLKREKILQLLDAQFLGELKAGHEPLSSAYIDDIGGGREVNTLATKLMGTEVKGVAILVGEFEEPNNVAHPLSDVQWAHIAVTLNKRGDRA